MSKRIETYREFWPYYLEQHRHPWTRRLHVLGTLAGIGGGLYLGFTLGWPWAFAGLAIAYAFAWPSHFFVEKNKPATFRYPLWSLFSDLRMLICVLGRRL